MNKMPKQVLKLAIATLTGLTITGLAQAPAAHAAEEVVVLLGAASRNFPVADLAAFAESGATSRQLQVYFDQLSPEQVQGLRDTLNYVVELQFVPFSRFLRTEGGECLLSQFATVIRPNRQDREGVQPLRAALVNTVAPGGALTLIDVLGQYPTQAIYVDQSELSGQANRLTTLSEDFNVVLQEAGVTEDPASLLSLDYDVLAEGTARLCEQL